MKRNLIALAALGLFAFGCSESPTETQADMAATPAFGAGNGVMHHVSAGSNDACEAFGLEPGCDGNFSLTATQKADGSVKGQWQDSFGPNGGVHVSIDCLNVQDNWAIIGGVITKGSGAAEGSEGQRALTAVVDNGKSKNDPVDQISFSIFPTGASCTDLTIDNFANLGFLFDLTRGQVTVK